MDSTYILALIIGLLGFTFAGIKSDAKMFSLFALGPAWLLIIEFQAQMLMVIVLASFMLFSVYYAIWGGRSD